jgi:ribonuclease P protein component
MKESFRLKKMEIPTGYDLIFIARNTITNAKCADVKRSLESALKRTGVMKK